MSGIRQVHGKSLLAGKATLMADGDLTPAEEERLTVDLLRNRVGIDPSKIGPLVDLASIGLVNGTWRNTCVENWHAEGRIHDGGMLRVNSHTTWRVRQLMRRWTQETGLDAEAPSSEFDGIESDDVWRLAGRLYRWFTSPARKLPTGVTLAQLAGDGLVLQGYIRPRPAMMPYPASNGHGSDLAVPTETRSTRPVVLAEYEDCVDLSLGAFGAQAEDRGARFGFARTATHGGLACQHWWGHPRWPAQVERFVEALDNPADSHWGLGCQHRAELSAEPSDVADRARLRRLLLSRPWELSADAAEWLVDAGIRYVKAAD